MKNRRKDWDVSEKDILDLEEELHEIRLRKYEGKTACDLLDEVEEDKASKKKLSEIRDMMKAIETQLNQAERLLRTVILKREREDRKVEDAILLNNGTMEIQEKETEA